MKKSKKMLLTCALVISLMSKYDIELIDILDKIPSIKEVFNFDDSAGLSDGLLQLQVSKTVKYSSGMINNIAKDFSNLYGINQEECMAMVHDNIDDILASEDPSRCLIDLIDNQVVYGYITPAPKDNLLGSGSGNISYVNKFKDSENGNVYKKYASMYGVDCDFALALAKQESNLKHDSHLPGGSGFNGFAYGISQIENSLVGNKFTVYNYAKKRNETIKIVYDYPSNPESGITYLSVYNYHDNVRIGVAKLQEMLVKYNYNLAMAMQAYNFGDGSFKKVLKAYSNETGKEIADIINDKKDFGWIKYVEKFHLNPNNFGVKWSHGTYGDKSYVKHVFQYITNPVLEFSIDDDSKLLINSYDQTTITVSNNEINKIKAAIDLVNGFKNEEEKVLVKK